MIGHHHHDHGSGTAHYNRMFAIGVGFSSLGNDVVKQANSLRELGNQVTVFFFFTSVFFLAVTIMVVE